MISTWPGRGFRLLLPQGYSVVRTLLRNKTAHSSPDIQKCIFFRFLQCEIGFKTFLNLLCRRSGAFGHVSPSGRQAKLMASSLMYTDLNAPNKKMWITHSQTNTFPWTSLLDVQISNFLTGAREYGQLSVARFLLFPEDDAAYPTYSILYPAYSVPLRIFYLLMLFLLYFHRMKEPFPQHRLRC